MRGVIGRRLSSPNNGFSFISITKQTPFLIKPTSRFSSSSSDGGAGRGRGRGDGGFPNQFGINRESENKGNEDVGGQGRGSSESQSHGGYGHGRGRPIQSDPAFSSFVKPDSSSSLGRGRGGGGGSDPVSPFAPPQQQSQPPPQQPRYQSQQPRFQPQQPRYQPQQQRSEFANGGSQGNLSSQLTREDQTQSQPHSPPPPETPLYAKEATLPPESKPGQTSPPNNALGSEFSHTNQRIVPESGAGRGTLPPVDSTQTRHHENRHIRPPQPLQQQRSQPQRKQYAQPPKDETPRPQLSREEAGRRARSELSRGEAEGSGVRGRGGGGGRGRGARGRGGRGRGGEGWRDDKKEEEAEQEAISVFVGDSADGEKFAKSIGPELMKNLAEGFEDVCERALPSTSHDALVDAYDTNLMIECEPEYAMPDFGSNPDIDEKPPMSLLECLEKVKPFIVAYEGIKDQEEWEEAIDEVMAQAPLIKEIVDHYSGPDRVTAKQQSEELDRIATTLPKSVPDSVKRFADRAALSLKSNPGLGFDKKYQFMDKLVMEVSQNYK
ncbi:unnamed protein product [Cochlearia groenlandica]